MSDGTSARARILSRLRTAPPQPAPVEPPPENPDWTPPVHGPGRLAKFRAMLEASRSEVHAATAADWPAVLRNILVKKGVRKVLFAPETAAGRQLAAAWGPDRVPGAGPALIPYDRPVEQMKPVLVHEADAAVTSTRGGIAHTGSLIVWPTVDEPRLMSLLPPIHVALVEESTIVDNLSEVIASDWNGGLPTNALLISGPSKTADIEQTLAYGVHGPKELVVLVIGQ